MSRRARTPDPFEGRIESALRPGKFVSYSDSFVFAKGLDELVRRCCTARSKSLTSLMPVAESPGAVRIGHPERGHLVGASVIKCW